MDEPVNPRRSPRRCTQMWPRMTGDALECVVMADRTRARPSTECMSAGLVHPPSWPNIISLARIISSNSAIKWLILEMKVDEVVAKDAPTMSENADMECFRIDESGYTGFDLLNLDGRYEH
jgi:hypothetical protein